MSQSRKTFEVSRFIQDCNNQLKLPNVSDDYRKGIISILEQVLHTTRNYNGFNYVGWCEEGGCDKWRADGEPKDNSSYLGNEYRRHYYTSTYFK